MLGFELQVLAKKLDRFGWDRDLGTATNDRLIADWMDALQDFPLDEVRSAIRDHLRAEPSRMPNEEHIRAIVQRNRAAWLQMNPPARPPEEPRVRVTAERAAEILAEVQSRTAQSIKPMPRGEDHG